MAGAAVEGEVGRPVRGDHAAGVREVEAAQFHVGLRAGHLGDVVRVRPNLVLEQAGREAGIEEA